MHATPFSARSTRTHDTRAMEGISPPNRACRGEQLCCNCSDACYHAEAAVARAKSSTAAAAVAVDATPDVTLRELGGEGGG